MHCSMSTSPGRATARACSRAALFAATLLLAGCLPLVGPDYEEPEAPLATEWMALDDPQLKPEAADYSAWWTVFDDPVLDSLVERAYEQNLSLRIAGIRVLQVQAARGISIGELYPQLQQAAGSAERVALSKQTAIPTPDRHFSDWRSGFDAAWELDLWGRFRRGIEAADASLLATVASYDDVLVSLVAEVAAAYVEIRTLQERLGAVLENVQVQERSYQIADVRFRNGAVTELDVQQAKSLLRDTQALIPQLESEIRQAENTLSFLLGMPPRDLQDLLGDPKPIPEPPAEVAVGIPAELLRRRPDIRAAEREVAAQSARIGIAVSELYPHFSLVGSVGIAADSFDDMFSSGSFDGFGGTGFSWAVLNYGRLRNNVRVQDAGYQQLVVNYENAVLRAQREVEDAIAAYLGSKEEVVLLSDGAQAAGRSVDLAALQYREGAVNYSRVLDSQTIKTRADDRLAFTRGVVDLSLIAMYKALGGGWELRGSRAFVPEGTEREMRARTNWGDLLAPEEQSEQLEQAAAGTEKDRGWWRWRWWWPLW
jgi:NodT family efflux transporter outer membrane factor (OMF) lipoprotein